MVILYCALAGEPQHKRVNSWTRAACWILPGLWCGCAAQPLAEQGKASPEGKAVEFLRREVPAWSRENGCYSCHNNGDAARALYAASRKGYSLSQNVLADTTAWVSQPAKWDSNKGDPGFSDKRLANIQFAAALLAALEAGHVKDTNALKDAARKVAADQGEDGAWRIDAQNTVGSPATYGTTLATYMAWKILREADGPQDAMRKAESWLQSAKPKNVPDAAILLWAATQSMPFAAHQAKCLEFLRLAQTHDGGWGPYADAPPEAFDTALVLLALSEFRKTGTIGEMVRGGRAFLIKEQNADGSWPATTRPRGSESYAQQVSTTGWAALALLKTR
jgi:hypothetical protein